MSRWAATSSDICEEEMKGEAVPARRGSVQSWMRRQRKQSDRKWRKTSVQGRSVEAAKRGQSQLQLQPTLSEMPTGMCDQTKFRGTERGRICHTGYMHTAGTLKLHCFTGSATSASAHTSVCYWWRFLFYSMKQASALIIPGLNSCPFKLGCQEGAAVMRTRADMEVTGHNGPIIQSTCTCLTRRGNPLNDVKTF